MIAKLLEIHGSWRSVADAARTTIGLDVGEGEPSSMWKRRMLFAEHSPIRKLIINWKWYDIKYWISTHFCRHKYGIEHFVKSQRPDRPNVTKNRDKEPQSALINHECSANAQAIINISRKRLCNQAMPETRKAWQEFLGSIKEVEPELYSVCVPECVYRNGLCPEYKTCGWNHTEEFEAELRVYLKDIKKQINNKTSIFK